MRTPIAWLNLRHRRARTIAALTGVAMAIVLIFLQIGFYRAAYRSAVMILEQFTFDIALVSSQYVFLRMPGSVERARLVQSLGTPGVAWTAPLYLGVARAKLPLRDLRREVAILAVDPANVPLRRAEDERKARLLGQIDTVLLDVKVGPGYETLRTGTQVEIDGHRVRIIGEYAHGPGFTGSVALMTGDQTFARVFGMRDRDSVSLGLVGITPGSDAEDVAARLRAVLPDDVRVFTRAGLERLEQDWSINVKPVGLMFTSGVLLAFVVGAVILYQVLATDIINHLREYATLRAMGSTTMDLNVLVWQQAVLYSTLGFLPASVVATLIYILIDSTTTLPTEMTPGKLAAVFLLVTIMCVLAATAAVRKVNQADPADLF